MRHKAQLENKERIKAGTTSYTPPVESDDEEEDDKGKELLY
jgi:hypothetical protein